MASRGRRPSKSLSDARSEPEARSWMMPEGPRRTEDGGRAESPGDVRSRPEVCTAPGLAARHGAGVAWEESGMKSAGAGPPKQAHSGALALQDPRYMSP